MDNATIQKFNDKLRELADNGVVEVGLEVGSDPGLSPEEYIQIPASMLKNCAVRLDSTSIAVYSTLPNARAVAGAPTERDAALSAAQQALANGWISCEWIEMHANTLRAHFEGRYLAIDRVVVDPHTVEDVRNFVTVNQGHMRDAEFNDAERNRILAIRFWAVATGLVATSKSEEYTVVPNPTTQHARADEMATFVLGYAENALTAAAARATSWRKSNHCTGGNLATGFPRRWLDKEGFWSADADRNTRRAAHLRQTSMFYVAAHGISVHAVLANMVPGDDHHWVLFRPSFGYVARWEVNASTRVRITPRTQVAGGAQVADSVQVLKAMVANGLAGIFRHLSQLPALMAAFATLDAEGMRCATYARWFFDGHPLAVDTVAWDQKSPAFADLIAEAAIAMTTLHPSSTLGRSPSLHNAATQSGDEAAKSLWTAISQEQGAVSQALTLSALGRLRGSSGQAALLQVASSDVADIKAGVTAYNTALTATATALGMTAPTAISADRVIERAGLTAPALAPAPATI